jgi:hypothetical protein
MMMRFLKLVALAVAIVGGALSLTGGASAAPIASGGLAATGVRTGLVQEAPFVYVGPRRRYYGYRRPYYRPYRPYYRPYYRGGPRVVCRVRYGPYGARRVCVRRW